LLCGNEFQWVIFFKAIPLSYKRFPIKLTLVPITWKQQKPGTQKWENLWVARIRSQQKYYKPRPCFTPYFCSWECRYKSIFV